MKTQHKLLVILTITTLLLFTGFILILQIQKQQNQILIQSGQEQQTAILRTGLEAKSDVVYRTLYDYTYWDDMIEYMNTGNKSWADDNLYTLFNSFGVNAVKMYTLDKRLVFNEERPDSSINIRLSIPDEVFPELLKNKFVKYYQKTQMGVLEVQGATMHGSKDEARTQRAYGYFFIAKLYDSTYIHDLERLTGGQITLTYEAPDTQMHSANQITIALPLPGLSANPTSWLQLSKSHEFLYAYKKLSNISLWFFGFLTIIILLIFFVSFQRFVNLPLNIISKALTTKSAKDRLGLLNLRSEFKKIGTLIETYFEQQESLEIEIEVRRKTEAQKEKLIVELDNANRELKDFAYIVSHDLKAPLRAIGSISQWIYTDYSDKIDDDGKQQLNLLLSRVHRMQNLIEGVLSYSRLTRVKEEAELTDLNKVVAEAIENVSPPAHFTINVDENLPTVLYGPTRILQVFQNLVSNGVKYNDKENGSITINCFDKGNLWEIKVADNGKGIEERYFEKIFQIFQTLQARDEFESTGIGLTIVKKIIETNGGTISVQSVAGKGTTFTFTVLKT